jgi:serine/threonine-protein kinase
VTRQAAETHRFGPFEVSQLLGRGGMAEVFKARFIEGPRTGQLVALKRLMPRLVADPEAIDLFTVEADVSRLLRHPNIVQVLEAGVVEDVYYLAMEWVDGRDLGQVLSRCRERKIILPTQFSLYIVRAALEALGYAHEAKGPSGLPLKVVHCDVSPSNLFISRLGEIKLGDFGIAKVRALGSTDVGTLWGKLPYLAPEQLERAPLSPQVDLWSAAAILYECLANRRALQGPNSQAMQAALRKGEIPPLEQLRPDLPQGLIDVVHKAMSLKPADRFQTAGELSAALQPFHDEMVGGQLGIASVVRGLFRAPGAPTS